MEFVAMPSIKKDYDEKSGNDDCSDWVATEKIHGSSFQFYTADGININPAGRRRDLTGHDTFVHCDIKKLQTEYEKYVGRYWQEIKSDDRWVLYRAANYSKSEEEGDVEIKIPDGECHVRIYGELYGGGGVANSYKMAMQREIIYSDEYRFYVYGVTVNQRWLTVTEMNDVCLKAGFPYYGTPVGEPQVSVQALKDSLVESGAIHSVSDFTDLPRGENCFLEGFVMTPLTRPESDYRYHSVKFLAPKFLDVKEAWFGKTRTANYCTKQRYHSVISKLDIDERMDTQLVTGLFLQDIFKDLPKNYHPGEKMKSVWVSYLLGWLVEDEYFTLSPENYKPGTLAVGGGAYSSEEATNSKDEHVNRNKILPEILQSFVLNFNEKFPHTVVYA